MYRFNQILLIASTVIASWLAMQAVHELGHVLAAWLTGAKVERVVLRLFGLSRTDVTDNLQPLAVAWGGPIFGVTLPVAAMLLGVGLGQTARERFLPVFVLRFFAGFCLIANGVYIGLGSFDRIGDCGEMLGNGARLWQLWVFGVLTAPAGLALWHGQGRYFGIGAKPDEIEARSVWGAMGACVALIVLFAAAEMTSA